MKKKILKKSIKKTPKRLINCLKDKTMARTYKPYELFFRPYKDIVHYVCNDMPNLSTFLSLCTYHDQHRLKDALSLELYRYYNYVYDTLDGFLFVPPKNCNVLLVAHLDTVHDDPVKNIYEMNTGKDTHIWSSEGIGGDDRCGIWLILRLLRETNIRPGIVFCEDEEIGALGASAFAKWFKETPYAEKITYALEFDRGGKEEAVFYNCINSQFEAEILSSTGYTKEFGTYSDISRICPAINRAGVNLTCGYYYEHTDFHYVSKKEMDQSFGVMVKLCRQSIKDNKVFVYDELPDREFKFDDPAFWEDKCSESLTESDEEYDSYLDVEAEYDI